MCSRIIAAKHIVCTLDEQDSTSAMCNNDKLARPNVPTGMMTMFSSCKKTARSPSQQRRVTNSMVMGLLESVEPEIAPQRNVQSTLAWGWKCPERGDTPIAGWFRMGHLIWMDDLGVSPILGNHHMVNSCRWMRAARTKSWPHDYYGFNCNERIYIFLHCASRETHSHLTFYEFDFHTVGQEGPFSYINIMSYRCLRMGHRTFQTHLSSTNECRSMCIPFVGQKYAQ